MIIQMTLMECVLSSAEVEQVMNQEIIRMLYENKICTLHTVNYMDISNFSNLYF